MAATETMLRGNPMTGNSVVVLIDEGNALEEEGRIAEAMVSYDAAVQKDPQCARAHLNRGNVLLSGAQIEDARRAYQLAIDCDPHYAAAHFNMGNLNFRAGDYARALQNYKAAIAIKPDFGSAYVAIGNVLESSGRAAEAMENFEHALAINPRDAGIHFNLALLATTQGRNEQAVDGLRRAIEIQPDYAEAHHQLGRVLSNLGDLDAAEASLRRALSILPESEDALCDLAGVLMAHGKSPEAVHLLVPKLQRVPTRMLKVAFARCIARTRFATNDPSVRAALVAAVTEAWAIPYQLWWPALSLLMTDPGAASCVRTVSAAWPARVPQAVLVSMPGFAALVSDPLLHALLEAAPVNTIEFERFLTATRHALLETVSSDQTPDSSDTAALPFYAALAQQCFINEYIFDWDVGERAAALACRSILLDKLDAGEIVSPWLLLAVAAYFPLHTLPEPSRLLTMDHRAVERVLNQQVREPLQEQALRPAVQRLTAITQGVSEAVRDQYEQNPYPRWVKMPRTEPALHFNSELRRTFPLARFAPLPDDRQPEMLIAGCGTGSQPILAAQ